MNARAPSTPPRVLAVASHPIQYHAPWFRALAQRPEIELSVLFVHEPDAKEQGRGFGIAFRWDLPLREGYRSRIARTTGSGAAFASRKLVDPRAELRDADIVLVTGWHVWPLVQLLRAARAARLPVIMRGESNALRERPFAVRLLHRALLSRCDAFLAIGRANRAFYRGYGIAEDRLFDAPYFVDNARFAADSAAARPQRAALRERWQVPPDAFCFVYAGKLEPKKRILDVLEALRRIHRERPVHLLVIGTGELMDEARAFVQAHALPVSFAGFLNQQEIAQGYVCADALVLPSDHGETWGLVVNEAMACGLPAIVSERVGCANDLVLPGETCSVVPFGDAAALADAMRHMARDPAAAAALGARAQARVIAEYGLERSVAGVLAAVDRVRRAR